MATDPIIKDHQLWIGFVQPEGHRTRAVFDRYNIVDEADLKDAGELLEKYAHKRTQERAARLRRVK